MTFLLNGLRATSVRRVSPWSGAWHAEVDVDLGEQLELRTGPAVLTLGARALVCTIDPAQSGRFGVRARARVVAGAGGWEKQIPAKHYKNDGGVLTTNVLSTTAAEVLERVLELAPGRFGRDFVRGAGAAAAVLEGLDWHLDDAGVTVVGPRVPAPAPRDWQILSWDARTRVATIATDDVVEPGTLLTDPRFGTAKIREVEQTWGDAGARATAWTVQAAATPPATAGNELVAVVGAIARAAAGSDYLAPAQYTVASQLPDGRFVLRSKDTSLPDLKAISLAPAVPGMSVIVPPGTILHVEFVGGDKSRPVVTRFEDGPTPVQIQIDATRVAVGGIAAPPVALAPPVITAIAALAAWCAALQAQMLLPENALVPALAAHMAPFSGTLAAAMLKVAPSVPSTKLFAEGVP